MRRTLLPLAIFALLAALSACGTNSDSGRSEATPQVTTSPGAGESSITPGTPPASTPPGTAPAAPGTTAPSTTAPANAAALTCVQLESAYLGNKTTKFNDLPDPVPLAAGQWAGENGMTITLQPACAIGDLTGDGAADALRALVLDGGGTGKFWHLALWRNNAGLPVYVNVAGLGDRTPIKTITVSGQKATVVYLTRPDTAPMSELSIRRTAIYRLSGSTLVEVSHTDAPYTL